MERIPLYGVRLSETQINSDKCAALVHPVVFIGIRYTQPLNAMTPFQRIWSPLSQNCEHIHVDQI